MRNTEAKNPPLFKADREIRLAFSADSGKIRIVYQGWDDAKVALEGEVFELSLGKQGLEGRILPKRRRGA
jgi:hypothetical protein